MLKRVECRTSNYNNWKNFIDRGVERLNYHLDKNFKSPEVGGVSQAFTRSMSLAVEAANPNIKLSTNTTLENSFKNFGLKLVDFFKYITNNWKFNAQAKKGSMSADRLRALVPLTRKNDYTAANKVKNMHLLKLVIESKDYSRQQKKIAQALMKYGQSKSMVDICKDYKVHRNTLSLWIREWNRGGSSAWGVEELVKPKGKSSSTKIPKLRIYVRNPERLDLIISDENIKAKTRTKARAVKEASFYTTQEAVAKEFKIDEYTFIDWIDAWNCGGLEWLLSC